MVVVIGQEALHIDKLSASDGLLTKWNGQYVLKKSNGSYHLDGIIGVEGKYNSLSTGNSGTISRVKKDDDFQELKSKSGELDSNQFPDILIIRLPDRMKDMLQRMGAEIIDLKECGIFKLRY